MATTSLTGAPIVTRVLHDHTTCITTATRVARVTVSFTTLGPILPRTTQSLTPKVTLREILMIGLHREILTTTLLHEILMTDLHREVLTTILRQEII